MLPCDLLKKISTANAVEMPSPSSEGVARPLTHLLKDVPFLVFLASLIASAFLSIFAVSLRFQNWFSRFGNCSMFKEDFICNLQQTYFLYCFSEFGINRQSLIGFFD